MSVMNAKLESGQSCCDLGAIGVLYAEQVSILFFLHSRAVLLFNMTVGLRKALLTVSQGLPRMVC